MSDSYVLRSTTLEAMQDEYLKTQDQKELLERFVYFLSAAKRDNWFYGESDFELVFMAYNSAKSFFIARKKSKCEITIGSIFDYLERYNRGKLMRKIFYYHETLTN